MGRTLSDTMYSEHLLHQVDKTDGLNVYLMDEKAFEAQIVHSLSQNMNVNLKIGTGDDWDWKEFPVPTQFVCKFGEGRKKLETGVSDIYEG